MLAPSATQESIHKPQHRCARTALVARGATPALPPAKAAQLERSPRTMSARIALPVSFHQSDLLDATDYARQELTAAQAKSIANHANQANSRWLEPTPAPFANLASTLLTLNLRSASTAGLGNMVSGVEWSF